MVFFSTPAIILPPEKPAVLWQQKRQKAIIPFIISGIGKVSGATTLFSSNPTFDNTSFAGQSLRVRTSGIVASATQVRVRFIAGSAGSVTSHCSIGIWIGSGIVNATTATPVELKFGGASGFSIGAGATITSDFATITVTSGQNLVVIQDFNTPGSIKHESGSTGDGDWKAAATSWNVANPTGFTEDGYRSGGFNLIEGL